MPQASEQDAAADVMGRLLGGGTVTVYVRQSGSARDYAANLRREGDLLVWDGEDRTHYERVLAVVGRPGGVLHVRLALSEQLVTFTPLSDEDAEGCPSEE